MPHIIARRIMTLFLAGVLVTGSLSACNRAGVQEGAEQPLNQDMGKSYVKEISPEEMKRREADLTSPQSEEKGPAVGGYDTGKADEQPKETMEQKAQEATE